LPSLLRTDKRLQQSEGVLEAYAESWALVYYLLKKRPKEFVAYMKMLSEKKPLMQETEEERIEQFEEIFGDLRRLDADFAKQMQRVK